MALLDLSGLWGWLAGVGALGVAGSLLQLVWKGVSARIERGRRLLEEARPELKPRGSLGTHGTVQLELENNGKDVARNALLGFTGVTVVAECRELWPGKGPVATNALDITGSRFFNPADDGPWNAIVTYADRYENPYKMLVPVDRDPRNDGSFNTRIRRNQYRNEAPKLGRWALYKLGGR